MNGKTVDDDDNGGNGRDGIRLNKVFKATHSRRAADALIKSGRVSINDVIVYGSSDDVGTRVMPYRDVVKLDGRVVTGWEGMNAMMDPSSMEDDIMNAVADIDDDESLGERMRHKRNLLRSTTSAFEYVKYHKPVGVTCTTDTRVPDNIVHSIRSRGYVPRHRVYPVGRLDRETSGLILLTSDGRVINSVLRGERKLPKVYDVMVDGNLSEDDLRSLRVSIYTYERN
jgi:16S rRNA U516 pseudouridylate synthase RsuA-like enzyme